MRRTSETRWLNHLLQTLILMTAAGLLCGTAAGVHAGWAHLRGGFHALFFDELVACIDRGLLVAFLYVTAYLVLFGLFRRFMKRPGGASFLAGSLLSLSTFLAVALRLDQSSLLQRPKVPEAALDLPILGAAAVLCALLPVLLYLWTRTRLLGEGKVPGKAFCTLAGIVLILNAAAPVWIRLNASGPNVVILLIDALRADHLSGYGYGRNTTPNIDRFAEDSAVFTQAVSQSTFTKTSIASLFTSKYPYQHRVYEGNLKDRANRITSDVLPEDARTLAEALSARGLYTGSWIHQGQLSASTGFAQGFVEFNERQGKIEGINRKFLAWTDEIGWKTPFFAYIHYNDLHDPYRPEPPYDTLYGVYSEEVYAGVDFKKWGFHRKQILTGERELKADDVEQWRAYYDGLLTHIDLEVERLLQGLKDRGIYDKSLIILTADHGDGFMEHGFISHSNTPYEELIRVPLIIRFPGGRFGGTVVDRQVRLVDVMPTILDVLGIPCRGLEGVSLLNHLDGERVEAYRDRYPEFAVSEYKNKLSIRTERYKFITVPGQGDALYDLTVDPGELNNLIDEDPRGAEAFQRLARLIASKREEREARRVSLDENAVQELRELGYIR